MPPANEKLIQHRCKNHVIIICHRSIFTCRNSSKKITEDKIKINACNHPTPKVHIYLQKHLKKDENIKINPCNHPTPKVHIYLQKQLKIDENIKINPCNQPTLKVHIYLQKHAKKCGQKMPKKQKRGESLTPRGRKQRDLLDGNAVPPLGAGASLPERPHRLRPAGVSNASMQGMFV